MLIALYCSLLLFLGYISFCFPIGLIVFRKLTVRSEYEKKSVVDTVSHVKDEKIMVPLLQAKEEWQNKPIEKVSIAMESIRGIGSFFSSLVSKNTLSADLWLHQQFNTNKTLAILVHGFTDSSSGLAYLAESYNDREISTLSINLRGHGESGGSFTGLGSYLTDGYDITTWVSYLRKRFGADIKIILHGVSMGGAAVIQAAFKYSLPVSLVVADCSFANYGQNAKKMIQSFFPKGWFSSLIILGIYFSANISNLFVNGFFFSKSNPQKVLSEACDTTIPILIFHGGKDSLVAIDCAKELYISAREPKKMVVIEDAPHIGSWFYEKEKYMNEVLSYLRD